MAITSNDIKLMASERMHDEDDGGGRLSGNEIVDGASNNMFPDVSELDRTYGRINLRKTFPAIMSGDTDTYFGGHAIVAEPPTDPAVHVCIFQSTHNNSGWTDERVNAQNKIESYVTIGPASPYRLVGDCYEGQRAILVYFRKESTYPAVGQILVLKAGDTEEFVKITRTDFQEEKQYIDVDGTAFTRTEATLDISDPLVNSFGGGTPHASDGYIPPTTIRATNTIPAVAYYGIQPLLNAVAPGDRTVKVADYKAHLLPATQSEEPLTDIMAGTVAPYEVSAGTRTVTMTPIVNTSGISIADETTRRLSYTGMALSPKPQPKTFTVAYQSQGKWYFIVDADGTGQLSGDGSGALNYTTGSYTITLQDYPDIDTRIISGWGSFQEVEQQSNAVIEFPKYLHTLQSVPVKPGSVTITWTVDGVVKTATDVAGQFTGDGTGFIIYGTGELEFTPATLPDMGTYLTFTYDKLTIVTETFTDVPKSGADAEYEVTLAQQPVLGTVFIKTKLSFHYRHHISTRIPYFTNYLRHTAQPDPGSQVLWPGGKWESSYEARYFQLLGEGSVRFRQGDSHSVITSSGLKLWVTDYYAEASVSDDGKSPIGNVDQATNVVSIFDRYWMQSKSRYPIYTKQAGICGCHWERVYVWDWNTTEERSYNNTVDLEISYTPTGAAETNITEHVPVQKTRIDLTANFDKGIVPNSVAFTLGGHTFFDWEGTMYRDPDASWVGTECGEINYDTGEIQLDWWVAGTPDISMRSMLVVLDPYLSNAIDSYSTLAPLRPQSFQIVATSVNGELLTGTADANGYIFGDRIYGHVDIQTGTFSVQFGDRVLATDLDADERAMGWYDDDYVDDEGYVIKPEPVLPETIRYNCVAYVYLPLSEDILGLSPVRLPFDGKVPIYRVGDIVVVHHTKQTVISAPVNGQVVDLGRSRLSWVKIIDGAGANVDTANYTPDLDAGSVVLDDVESLPTPITVFDRIEDMALINDLMIDGTLTVTKSFSHNFPVGAYASSALILKDMFAHISNVFEQKTWQDNWIDELEGDAPVARYNDALYPIEITNEGGTQERWALVFTGSTTFKVLGEFSGQIAVGNINEDCSPVNMRTGNPYFTIKSAGWGAGWSTDNVLRFNSIAANKPLWVARTILQSDVMTGSDKFCIEIRGDVNTD